MVLRNAFSNDSAVLARGLGGGVAKPRGAVGHVVVEVLGGIGDLAGDAGDLFFDRARRGLNPRWKSGLPACPSLLDRRRLNTDKYPTRQNAKSFTTGTFPPPAALLSLVAYPASTEKSMFQHRPSAFDPRLDAIAEQLRAIEKQLGGITKTASDRAAATASSAGTQFAEAIGPILNDVLDRFRRGQSLPSTRLRASATRPQGSALK